ncbi:hypothetical protein BDY24DRAFT_441249 [Mrakia frigida]|uniref:uncharacterized protein n=1 Tax=Mrakia frigida TaxID=29902 RepID=UPI003FCBF1FE
MLSRSLLLSLPRRSFSSTLPLPSREPYVPEGGWSTDRYRPEDYGNHAQKTYSGHAAAPGGQGQNIHLPEVAPVSELLTNPKPPVPSYRSPTTDVWVPLPPPTPTRREGEGGEGGGEGGGGLVVDEMDPWKNYVPPQTVPRRDIYKETFDRVAAKKARDSRESFFGRYGLSMVVVGAWTLASYTILRSYRTSLSGDRQLSVQEDLVLEKRLELEQALLERDKRLVGLVKGGKAGSGSGSGKWWSW